MTLGLSRAVSGVNARLWDGKKGEYCSIPCFFYVFSLFGKIFRQNLDELTNIIASNCLLMFIGVSSVNHAKSRLDGHNKR